MSVAHTILGVLMDAPAHGYAIKKQLAGAPTAGEGPLNDGQLYPALARMEREGWITKEVVEQRRSPSKHLYRLTDAGRGEFFDWLAGDRSRAPHPWKFDFLQRCAFLRHLDPGRVELQLAAEIERVSECLTGLERFAGEVAARDPDLYREMLVDYGIRIQRLRRDWLEELQGRVTRSTLPVAAARNA